MSSIHRVKQHQCAIIGRCAESSAGCGAAQLLTTLVPFALLWWAAVRGASVSLWLTAIATLLIAFLTLRVFAPIHDCGHGSLFRSHWLNRSVGFCLGVLAGMPQYVWSQHHHCHQAQNGNCDR